MPSSMDQGKDWGHEQIMALAPARILDVGPGLGRYRDLIGDDLVAEWWAVEVWAPYVERYALAERYDHVIVEDVRAFDWPTTFDLVILGDVLEHMPRSDALQVWGQARAHARNVLLSLPIVPYPQATEEGNPYEAHVETWSDAECRALPGVRAGQANPVVGVYLAGGLV